MECKFNGTLRVWIKTLIFLSVNLRPSITTTTGGILCPGGQHTLVCSTDHLFLEWSVRKTSQPALHMMRSVSSSGQNPVISPILIVNAASITFSRESSQMALPLVSTMTIEDINNDLNGTMITCTGQNSSSVSSVVLMLTVHVFDINTESDVPNPPVIAIRSSQIHFEHDNFTVTLEWSQFSGETYSVTTVPDAVHQNYILGSIQIVMRYNTPYNVTVTATLCGHRNATNFTTIHRSKCDLPMLREAVIYISDSTEGPLIGGSIISYSCSIGQTISGPNTSICTDNGHWEPDPMDTSCPEPSLLSIPISRATTSSEITNNQSYTTDTVSPEEMNDSSLLEISIAISVILPICLISITIITIVVIIALKRRGIRYFRKIKNNQENSSKCQASLTTSVQELEDVHEMTSTEADQSCTLVYADVFSSSTVRSKPHNVTLTVFDDDRVNYAEVSHTLKSKISQSTVDSLLNLDNLLIEIKRDATQVWYQLGEALGIEKKILDKFTTCSSEEAIIEVLDYWLKNHTGKPTWKEVTDALRKIHLHESALGIERIYETGELSAVIDLDINQVTEAKNRVIDFESPPPIPPKGT